MWIFKACVGLWLIGISGFCLQAQDSAIPLTLDLEDAMRLAVERNPALAAAKSEIQAAEGERIAASRRPNPAFTLEFEDLPISTHTGPFFNAQEITSRIDYEIETGGRRGLRTQAADQTIHARRLQYQEQIRRMRLQVQQAFFETVLAKSNFESSNMILDQVDRMISLNRVRFREGDISALDLNRIEVEKHRFQDDVFQADLALRNAKSSLLALLNAPDLSRDIDVAGALAIDAGRPEPGLPPEAASNALLGMALAQRPDFQARIREQEKSETEIRLQKAIRLPNLTVGGGYKRNLTDNAVVFGMTIPLPVFNRNQGEILRAHAEQKRAQYLVAAAQQEVRLDVQKALNAVEVNRRRVEYIRTQQLQRAEEASRVTLESYNLGGGTLIDYLDAQRTYRDTLRTYNQALFERRLSLYALSNAIALGAQ